ncbi:hypothetical protein MY55_21275 [Chromobacterium subtsugae]|nr:hypothetical protein MY55_21275 [Chromobacterium subtsugae]
MLAILCLGALCGCATPQERLKEVRDAAIKGCDPELAELLAARARAAASLDQITTALLDGQIHDHANNPGTQECIQNAMNMEMQMRTQNAMLFNAAMRQMPQMLTRPQIVPTAPMTAPEMPAPPAPTQITCTPQTGTFTTPSIICQ